MNKMRTIGLMAITAVMTLGTFGIAAPAHADTSWYCPTCFAAPTAQH
jgi:hypothetical protein